MPATLPKPKKILVVVTAVIVVVAASVLLLDRSVSSPVSHDEHEFVAGAEMVRLNGAMPYRDFPLFHTPNLVYLYSALFALGRHLLLIARLVSVACAAGLLAALFAATYARFAQLGQAKRLAIAAGAVVVLLTNPQFAFVTGWGWNHASSTLLAVLALLAHLHAGRTRHPIRWTFCSGLLLSLAAGTRLSFAPLGLPFLIGIFLFPSLSRRRQRLGAVAVFIAGGLVGFAPTLALLASAPRAFFFNNYQFRMLYIQYAQLHYLGRVHHGMSLASKLLYMRREILMAHPATLALCVAYVCMLLASPGRWWRGRREHFEVALTLMVLLVLLAGALMPTPVHYQYFFALVPFLLLGLVIMTAAKAPDPGGRSRGLALLAMVAMVGVVHGSDLYLRDGSLIQPSRWRPVVAHRAGQALRRVAGGGKILTFAASYPLEGGGAIYPELANGPYAWRVGPYMTPEQRRRLQVLSAEDLEAFLRDDPPAGVLVGFEGDQDKPLIEYARRHGYRRTAVEGLPDAALWLPAAPAEP